MGEIKISACIPRSKEDWVTFQAELYGTAECSSVCLEDSIKTWVSKEQIITVKNLSMTVQNIKPNCIILPSFQDKTCSSKENPPVCNVEEYKIILGTVPPIAAAIIGGVVGFLLNNICCKKSQDGTKRTCCKYGATDKKCIQGPDEEAPLTEDSVNDDHETEPSVPS